MIQNEENVDPGLEKFKNLKPSPDRVYNAPQRATQRAEDPSAESEHQHIIELRSTNTT